MKSIDLLKSMDIFGQVAEEDLNKIAGLLKERRIGKDTVIFRQGDAGDSLYIVLSGRVKCFTTDAQNREKVLSFFSEGQFFGEMAVLTGEPRSATMQAVGDTRLLTLRKDDFDSFLAHNVQVMLEMMKVIAQRQAASNVRLVREQGPEGIEAQPSTPAGRGKVLTVFSPKGGVGKSTIAVNLAVALAHREAESVVLVDLSLTFGHAMLLLNMAPKSSLSSTNATSVSRMELNDLAYYLAAHPSSGLRVVNGSTRPEEGEAVAGDTAKAMIEQLRRHFSYIVIDTGSNFSDPVLAALENADQVLLLCSPEISVLRDVKECQRILNDVVHLKRDKILYIMNYIFPFKTLSKEQFESSLQTPLYAELPYGNDVPAKAALRGESFVETQAGAAISKGIQKLAVELSTEKEKAKVGAAQKKGLFR